MNNINKDGKFTYFGFIRLLINVKRFIVQIIKLGSI